MDSAKWIPSYQWGQTHNYNAYCDPNNVLIENGLLRLKVEDKPSHGKKYTSAVITSYGKFSQKYGYFEGRFRIPTGKGLWPAFWMLPYPQHWPPEIDIFETIKDDPKVYMTYHWNDQGHKSSGKHWTEEGFSYSKEFHTYGLLWEPDKIVWYIDGVERARFTDAKVIVNEPMYLLINFGSMPTGRAPVTRRRRSRATTSATGSGCTRGIDSGQIRIVIREYSHPMGASGRS